MADARRLRPIAGGASTGCAMGQVALCRASRCCRHRQPSRARAERPSTSSAAIDRESPTATNLVAAPQIFMAVLPPCRCDPGTLLHGERAGIALVVLCQAVSVPTSSVVFHASGALAEKLHMDIDYAAVGRSHDGCWPGPTRPVASGPEVGLAARRRDLE